MFSKKKFTTHKKIILKQNQKILSAKNALSNPQTILKSMTMSSFNKKSFLEQIQQKYLSEDMSFLIKE